MDRRDTYAQHFAFDIGQKVANTVSNQQGTVVGRAQYQFDEPSYLVYTATEGDFKRLWWPESVIVSPDTL